MFLFLRVGIKVKIPSKKISGDCRCTVGFKSSVKGSRSAEYPVQWMDNYLP